MNVTIWEILGVDVTDNCKVVGQKLFYAFLSIHSSYRCAVKSAKGKICHSKIQTKRSFHSFVIDGVDWMCTLRVVCFTTNTLKYECIVLVVHSVTQSLPILRTHFEKCHIQPDSSWISHLGYKLCDHLPATVFQCPILVREAMFFDVKQWLHSFRPGREGWRRIANGYLMLPLVAF